MSKNVKKIVYHRCKVTTLRFSFGHVFQIADQYNIIYCSITILVMSHVGKRKIARFWIRSGSSLCSTAVYLSTPHIRDFLPCLGRTRKTNLSKGSLFYL